MTRLCKCCIISLMKVLIFTVSVGNGHDTMCSAIASFLSRHDDCKIMVSDIFKNKHETQNTITNDIYFWFVEHNINMVNGVYRWLNKDHTGKKHTLAHKLISPAIKSIQNTINTFRPDIIICAHVYPTIILSDLREKNQLDIPFIFLTSDFIPTIYLECAPNIDYIISPSDLIHDKYLQKGFAPEKILHYGIPVRSKICDVIEKPIAREIVNVNPDKFTILVMNGGFGVGNTLEVIKNILESKHDFQMIVVNGSNQKMKDKIDEFIESNSVSNIYNLGYSKKISELLSASDLLIGKAGGLTVSEALNKRLPILAVKNLPWQEYDNMLFLKENGAGEYIDDENKIYSIIDKFIENPEILENMRKNIDLIAKPNATRDICNFILSLADKNQI